MTVVDRPLLHLWQRSQQLLEHTFEQAIEQTIERLSTWLPTSRATLWIGDWGTLPLTNVEIRAFDRVLELKVALPQVVADIDIQVSPETVLIRAEQTETAEVEGYYRTSYCSGSFHSLIPLPHRVYPDIIKAELTDGILLLQLAKAGKAAQDSFRFRLTDPSMSVSPVETLTETLTLKV